MQSQDLDLNTAIETNIYNLKSTIDELNGALEIATKIKKENTSFQKIDVDYYWKLIRKKQQNRIHFINFIENDYLMFELDLFDGMMKRVFFHNFKGSRKRYGVKTAILLLLLMCFIRGVSAKFLWHESFLEGALYPALLFLIGSIIMLPLYILSKRKPKVAAIISSILVIAGIAFLVLLVLLIIVLLLNSFFVFGFNFAK